ncbi:MAG: hypothetical protein QM477_00680 [Planctomycetota bacterium]
MILSTLILCSLQTGSFDAAIADASALASKNNFHGAVQLLKDAGVEDSTDAAGWTAYGEMTAKWTEFEIGAGRIGGLDAYDAWNDVAWIYEKAASMSGAEDKVWVNWSEAMLNGNDVVNSLRTVEDGLAKFPKSAALLMQQGRVLMSLARASAEVGNAETASEEFGQAEAAFRAAMKAAPKTAAPCLRLGELQWTLYFNSGQSDQAMHDGAIESFMSAAKRDAAGVDGGMVSNWLGAESLPILDVLIKNQPDEVLNYWYRGSTYYAQGPEAWPHTRDDFLKVLQLNPNFTNAYYFLADGAMQRGQSLDKTGKDALQEKAYGAAAKFWALYLKDFGPTYLQSVKKNPDGAKDAATRMNWLAGKSTMDNGIILLEWATTANPGFADAWNNLALFYRDTREAEKSLKAYAKAHELKPDDPQIMNDYAVIYHYYLKTKDDVARQLYKQAISRAEAMLESGEVKEADQNRIRTALHDAKNNLKKLDAGNRKNS